MNRAIVNNDYGTAEMVNKERHLAGNVKYGVEYIYENQKTDAKKIVGVFYNTEVRAISVLKRIKLGMDGLMIEISKLFATHVDDNFALHRDNIFITTGMSNRLWEDDMKEKIPNCFKNNVYHHGKLESFHKKVKKIKNALIIIDEVDTGDKRFQMLHTILKGCGFLDLKYMNENNIRFVFVSATSINQIHELTKWGDEHHYTYSMTIPDNYIGHNEFLEKGITKEYYLVNSLESSTKWVKNDIIDNYGSDYRIYIIRTDDGNKQFLEMACSQNNIDFRNHSCDERIDQDELNQMFSTKLERHLVIAIKGLYRRANYIPNEWKLKIGATHERCTAKYDTSVEIQGLPGRMTGYWKNEIINGHKTGSYRTSIQAMLEYDKFYNNPIGTKIDYSTNNTDTFVSARYIKNLNKTEQPISAIERVPVTVNCIDSNIFNIKKRKDRVECVKQILLDKPEYATLLQFISKKKISVSKFTNLKT
jgi:hypothetical protein